MVDGADSNRPTYRPTVSIIAYWSRGRICLSFRVRLVCRSVGDKGRYARIPRIRNKKPIVDDDIKQADLYEFSATCDLCIEKAAASAGDVGVREGLGNVAFCFWSFE